MKPKFQMLSIMLVIMLTGLSGQQLSVYGNSTSPLQRVVYTGNLIYFDGSFGPFSGTSRAGSNVQFFKLTINEYTPENEVSALLGALQEDGQDGLMKALKKKKRGTLQIGTKLARDVQAVWITETEDGRKITALAERWLGFEELRRGARSVDYPFTYIEIYIDEKGKSEGSLIPAARVRSKGANTIEIENFGIYPARLVNIKPERKLRSAIPTFNRTQISLCAD